MPSIESPEKASGVAPDIVTELNSKLMHYCLHLTENRYSAEELVQEAWMKALHALKLDSHSNPQAYLFRIAKHAWIDQCRKQKVARRYTMLEKSRDTAALSLELGFEHLELIFHTLIKHLTPLQRAVFLLKDVYEYSILEIANKLNMTQGAVKAALHRARKSLNGVRRDLDASDIQYPNDLGYIALLRCLAASFQNGDATRVIELSILKEVEASTAYAVTVQQRLARKSAASSIKQQGTPLYLAA